MARTGHPNQDMTTANEGGSVSIGKTGESVAAPREVGHATLQPDVAVLTGGGDKPYALGLADALIAQSVRFDFIGSTDVDSPALHETPLVNVLNLRGDQRSDSGLQEKAWRVLRYYARLLRYAAAAQPGLFHILWNNKFQLFDRTGLMVYYKLLGKRIVLTVHNVNAGKRDGNDSLLNRLTLRVQYGLCDHLFVHTARMKTELMQEFAVPDSKISVIPFGINNTSPVSELTTRDARKYFGLVERDKVLLFFGNIAPYKGLDLLVAAFAQVARRCDRCRLIIAGKPKNCESYWQSVQSAIDRHGLGQQILQRIDYIADDQVELYFKAADVLILPYRHIFQSGVLFLGYSFGLPVIASDVGSMREDIVDGRTGFVCRPNDPGDLGQAIDRYFASDLYRELERRRPWIRQYANEHYSWAKVGEITRRVYGQLLGR